MALSVDQQDELPITIASQISINFSSEEEADNDNTAFEKILDVEQATRRRTDTENENITTSPISKFKHDFSSALNEVEKIDRSSKINVMEAIPRYPKIIQKVVYAVTALPTTQASVKRLFSALRIIRSDLRASMKDDLTEAILFLRTNSF